MRWSLVPRIAALALVVLAGVYYIAIDVLGYHVGAQPYHVSVLLPRAGGLYPEGDVTYRGVPVGKVTNLDLSTTGVKAELDIDHGVRIPADSRAAVRQLSALGEQYIDLVPAGTAGPYLHPGSVIPESRTTVPLQIGTFLHDTGTLVSAINPSDIQTLEQFLTTGFGGTDTDLRQLIGSGQTLADALIAAQQGSSELINDGSTILHTALNTGQEFAAFNAAIEQITATFKSSDSDLQSLITNGNAAAQNANPALAEDSASIEQLISGFGSAGTASLAYQQAVQALFAVLPVVASDLSSVGSNGELRGELGLNTNETVCPYVPGSQQALPTQSTGTAALNNQCSITAPDLLQRGAQNAPVVK
jgi:phospholipid/cholesterol/gamma-HCH transport system substrate-binding protein